MAELLLGRVAGSAIGRLALRGDSFNTGYGYGVYLTDNPIIGISYKKEIRPLALSTLPGWSMSGSIVNLGGCLCQTHWSLGQPGNPYAITWAPIVFGSAAATLISPISGTRECCKEDRGTGS